MISPLTGSAERRVLRVSIETYIYHGLDLELIEG
jgi:hypothetical protein